MRLQRPELAAIAGSAFALRLAHLFALSRSPFYPHQLGDSAGYSAWAERLAGGDWLGNEVFYQAPLYPYFLGVVYALGGASWWTPRLIQCALGALACALVAAGTAQRFGRAAGLAAGLCLALCAPAIFFDALIQKSSLDALALAVLVWLTSADGGLGARNALALGAAAGAIALLRENALALLPWLGAWTWQRAGGAGGGARGLAAFALGAGLLLVPVALRNYAISGELHLTTSQLGPNFWLGNHAGSRGIYEPLRPGRGSFVYEREDAIALAERAVGRELGPAEVSAYWLDRALADIAADPARWLRLLAIKLGLLLQARELVDSEDVYSAAEYSPALRALVPVVHFGTLLPLALFGAWIHRRRLRRDWLLPVLAIAYAASVVVFYVFARYRYPLIPLLVPFAGAGLAAAPGWLRESSRRERAAVLAALAIVAGYSNWPRGGSDEMRAVTWYNLGNAERSAGHADRAELNYRRALDWLPDFADARHNLADLLASQGRREEAEALYRDNLARSPDHAASHNNLANLLRARGELDAAIDHYQRALRADPADRQTRHNLALAWLAAGRPSEAAAVYRALIAESPRDTAAQLGLARAYADAGNRDGARAALERCLELAPGEPVAAYELAKLLLEASPPSSAELARALALARSAVSATSGREPRAQLLLARAALANGARDAAIAALRAALARSGRDRALRREIRGELRALGATLRRPAADAAGDARGARRASGDATRAPE
jgi:tetratricopeptide (TPR) repeat protein